MVHAFAAYVGAALAEIAGCFAFWAWLRLDRTALWVLPGMLSLALFAFLVPTSARRSPGPPRPMGMS